MFCFYFCILLGEWHFVCFVFQQHWMNQTSLYEQLYKVITSFTKDTGASSFPFVSSLPSVSSFTVGFLSLLLCDELSESDWYIHPSGNSQGKVNKLLQYLLGSGQGIFMHQLHKWKMSCHILYFCVLATVCPSVLSTDYIHCIWTADKTTVSWCKSKVPGWVLFFWNIHPHPADRWIQLHLKELLQHKIHQEGQCKVPGQPFTSSYTPEPWPPSTLRHILLISNAL